VISNRSLVRNLIAGTILALSILAAAAESPTMTASKTGYAPVNGLNLYYEIHGTGKPLVLLNGGAGAIEIFSSIMLDLSRNHGVIAMDLQAHGRTADIARPLRYEVMTDDIADLIQYLGIEKADVMGYALGGEVALRVAIQHPQAVRKLVLISVAYKSSGWYPEILAAEARTGREVFEQMKQTPMYQLYQRTAAPRPAHWPVLLGKLNRLLNVKESLNVAGGIRQLRHLYG
jgi:pimeloyl-ACP methyl ester carboxylesterase